MNSTINDLKKEIIEQTINGGIRIKTNDLLDIIDMVSKSSYNQGVLDAQDKFIKDLTELDSKQLERKYI